MITIFCSRRLRELAFLNKGIKIIYRDERDTEHPEICLFYEGGIVSFVTYLNENKIPLFPKPIYIHGVKDVSDGPVDFEVACSGTTPIPRISTLTSTIFRRARAERTSPDFLQR